MVTLLAARAHKAVAVNVAAVVMVVPLLQQVEAVAVNVAVAAVVPLLQQVEVVAATAR